MARGKRELDSIKTKREFSFFIGRIEWQEENNSLDKIKNIYLKKTTEKVWKWSPLIQMINRNNKTVSTLKNNGKTKALRSDGEEGGTDT